MNMQLRRWAGHGSSVRVGLAYSNFTSAQDLYWARVTHASMTVILDQQVSEHRRGKDFSRAGRDKK